jgi:hypothetical protein
MPRVTARRPHHDHHPAAQRSHRDDPLFAVVVPLVRNLETLAGEDFGGVGKIQPAALHGRGSLDRIVSDLHLIIVSTDKPLASALQARSCCPLSLAIAKNRKILQVVGRPRRDSAARRTFCRIAWRRLR